MPPSSRVDNCRLCGVRGPLSREHIPPQVAWDGRFRVRVQNFEQLNAGRRGNHYQSGYFDWVLCEECNNRTGQWYGAEYVEWSRWGLKVLDDTSGRAEGEYEYSGYPLRIAKQVITMMIASSSEELTREFPELRSFVLDRYAVGLPAHVRVHTYFVASTEGRTTGLAWAQRSGGPRHRFCDISLPPMGYLLTVEGVPLDERPVDITWITTVPYDQKVRLRIHLPVLPTVSPYPGDFRSAREIRQHELQNFLTEKGHPDPEGEAERIMREDGGAYPPLDREPYSPW